MSNFVMYSLVGYDSWVNRTSGSCMIKHLVDDMINHCHELEIQKLLTMVGELDMNYV